MSVIDFTVVIRREQGCNLSSTFPEVNNSWKLLCAHWQLHLPNYTSNVIALALKLSSHSEDIEDTINSNLLVSCPYFCNLFYQGTVQDWTWLMPEIGYLVHCYGSPHEHCFKDDTVDDSFSFTFQRNGCEKEWIFFKFINILVDFVWKRWSYHVI